MCKHFAWDWSLIAFEKGLQFCENHTHPNQAELCLNPEPLFVYNSGKNSVFFEQKGVKSVNICVNNFFGRIV